MLYKGHYEVGEELGQRGLALSSKGENSQREKWGGEKEESPKRNLGKQRVQGRHFLAVISALGKIFSKVPMVTNGSL